MRAVVIQFPGSNREQDAAIALSEVGFSVDILASHVSEKLTDYDLIMLPGGFSYGDYLRCGAMAARLPIMQDVIKAAHFGTRIVGICNGFQILTEAQLLPGALMMNSSQLFVCRWVEMEVTQNTSLFTKHYQAGQKICLPVAHHEGNYLVKDDTLKSLEDSGRIVFRYQAHDNPNGSVNHIAGVTNAMGNVMGMMPHPENATLSYHQNQDGLALFSSLIEGIH